MAKRTDLVSESIRARLYGMTYGKFQEQKNIKISDELMRQRHKVWQQAREEQNDEKRICGLFNGS